MQVGFVFLAGVGKQGESLMWGFEELLEGEGEKSVTIPSDPIREQQQQEGAGLPLKQQSATSSFGGLQMPGPWRRS